MFIAYSKLDVQAIAKRWWTLVVRGVAAIAFGVLTLVWPSSSLLALVLLWGAYALMDGAASVALAVRAGRAKRSWGWLLFDGLVGLAAGVVTLLWPQLTALALLVLIAVWAIVTGIAKVLAAVELRRVIRGEWLLGGSGLVSIAFGALLLVFPGAGALAVVTLIGVHAIAFGALLSLLGFRVRRLATRALAPPQAGTPQHA